MNVIFKSNVLQAVQWDDNCREIKRLCGDNCIITYESSCIDDYWLLKVSTHKGDFETVARWDWVVRFNDGTFAVYDNAQFQSLFECVYKTDTDKMDDSCESDSVKEENDIIPEGSKVKIKHCKPDHYQCLYVGKVGTVRHYWPNNPYGEYNVIVDDRYNDCFDRDELEVIDYDK